MTTATATAMTVTPDGSGGLSVTFTPDSTLAAARYWRLLLVEAQSYSYQIAEFQFRSTAGTAELFSTDTIPPLLQSSNYNSGTSVIYAADNDLSTGWTAFQAALAEYIGYDYGSGNTFLPAEVSLESGTGGNYGFMPAQFYLQSSSDGTSWNCGQFFICAAWTGNSQTQLFAVDSMQFSTVALPSALTMPVTALDPKIELVLNNWDPSTQFAQCRTAMARITGNTGRFKVCYAGDSGTLGYGTTGSPGYHLQGFPYYAATNIATATSSAVIGSFNNACLGNPFEPSGVDDRLTFSGDAGQSGGLGFGGTLASFNTSTTGTVDFAATVAFDHIEVVYAQYGSFTVGVDGGTPSATHATTDSSGNMTRQVWAVSHGTHTVNLTGVISGTACYVQSISCYDSTSPAIECMNGGIGGATSGSWNQATTGVTTLAGILAENPDLVVLDIGRNDGNNNNVTATTYQTNVQAIVDAVQGIGADIILIAPEPVSLTSTMESGSDPYWMQYRAALYTIAAGSNVPVVDLHTYYLSFPFESSRGWMSDDLHPNETFYADIGSVHAELILAAGGYITS